jgi:hypothetical protein
MNRLALPALVALVLLSACHHQPRALSAEGRNVRTGTSDPPRECQEIGNVQGVGYTFDEAKDDARNKTAAKGGNYLRLEAMGRSVGVVGTAFRCP